MDAFLAHAIVNPDTSPEQMCAKALGLELRGKLREKLQATVWRARTMEDEEVALVTLDPASSDAVRDRFAATAIKLRELALPRILRVRDVAPRRDAYVADLWSTGTARDLPALRWPLRRRLELVAAVGEALAGLHGGGLAHGSLTLDAVQFDDDLEPVVADVGLVPDDAPAADVAGDIAAFGNMIEEVAGAESLPSLDELVRRCTAGLPSARPANVKQVLAALAFVIEGLPDSDEVMPVAPRAPAPADSATRPSPIRKPTPAVAFDPKARAADAVRKPTPPVGFRPVPGGVPDAAKRGAGGPSPTLVRGVGLAGVLAFAVALVSGWFLGGGGGLAGPLTVLSIVGAALATLLVPALRRGGRAVRVVLAAGLAAIVWILSPVDSVSRLGAIQRIHGNADARRAAIAEVMRLDRDLRGAALSGLDLSGLDFTAADLRGADLSHTDLSRARLWAAQLEGASLEGAKLAGADLDQSTLAQALNVGTASCDTASHLPAGWKCRDGSPIW